MHNVLLGSAKHMMILWKENKSVTETHFTNIQAIVDKFVTPVDIGRIPYKIASGFIAFTADQWKNWSLALKDILPDGHYRCWLPDILPEQEVQPIRSSHQRSHYLDLNRNHWNYKHKKDLHCEGIHDETIGHQIGSSRSLKI